MDATDNITRWNVERVCWQIETERSNSSLSHPGPAEEGRTPLASETAVRVRVLLLLLLLVVVVASIVITKCDVGWIGFKIILFFLFSFVATEEPSFKYSLFFLIFVKKEKKELWKYF